MTPTLHRGLLAGLLLAACAPAFASEGDDESSLCISGPASNASHTDDYTLKTPLRMVGLTADGQLVCFVDRKPGKLRVIGTVGGLVGDTALVGIDFRPQDGLLYGVGNAGGVYRVDALTATATSVGALTVLVDGVRVPLALQGTAFGVDFNPAANALRIVSNTGQNLRQPFGGLGSADGLAVTVVDMPLSAAGVVAAAYTNNDPAAAATGTTLFDLNATQVLLQSPPNNGNLVATGALGVTATGDAGFDIYSVLRGGVTVDQRALAALTVGGLAGLYDVNLLTGKASARGSLGAAVVDIAVPLNQY